MSDIAPTPSNAGSAGRAATAAGTAVEGVIAIGEGGALPTTNLLPFTFARKFGVVLTGEVGEDGRSIAAFKTQPTLTTLQELQRYSGRALSPQPVSEADFEELLTNVYSRDASAAKQMVEDMGDELDLASLADSVPETEDLLEQEDDAPIIRLINALLAEAIRENASDIHIETFERELTVRFRVDGVMREVVRPKAGAGTLTGLAYQGHGKARHC